MSTTPKVAFWLPSFEMTGLQTSTIRVAQTLTQQGVLVDLVVCHNKGPSSRMVKDPVRVVDLKQSSGHLGRGLLRVLRYVFRERPTAICACSGSGYLLAALVRLIGAKTQVWIWELSTKQYRELAKVIETRGKGLSWSRVAWRSIVRPIYGMGQRAFMGTTSGVITNSRAVADELRENSFATQRKIRVIYNACISDKSVKIPNKQRTWPMKIGNVALIVNVGRLSVVKDLDVLLRAFRVLRNERPAYLTIVGDGPQESQLAKLREDLALSDDVQLSGFKDDPFADLQFADLFVLSSRTEPFGNVLVEAMAAGLPVVSTDCTGPREILDIGRYGPLVPVGDHLALAAAMAQVLDNPPDRDVLRMRAMDFHADKIAAQYRDAFGI